MNFKSKGLPPPIRKLNPKTGLTEPVKQYVELTPKLAQSLDLEELAALLTKRNKSLGKLGDLESLKQMLKNLPKKMRARMRTDNG